MLNLFFRKNFYDGWDNLILIFIPNFILDALVVVAGLLCVPAFTLFKNSNWYLYIILAVIVGLIIALCIFNLAWAKTAYDLVDYGSPEIKDFFKNLKGCVADGIKFGLTWIVFLFIALLGIKILLFPQTGTIPAGEEVIQEVAASTIQVAQGVTPVGLLSGFILVWFSLAIVMILCWYPVVRAALNKSYSVSLKKCFYLFMDNIGKNLILSVYNLFLLILSVIMMGIAPGMAGVQISRANFLRLLLKKYDYIEELDKQGEPANSRARRFIPWKKILEEENEINPPRPAKEFFFPWRVDNGSGKPEEPVPDAPEDELEE